jgi:hypothetical protein
LQRSTDIFFVAAIGVAQRFPIRVRTAYAFGVSHLWRSVHEIIRSHAAAANWSLAWREREFLSADQTSKERLLTAFPTINHFTAQLICNLTQVPLKVCDLSFFFVR